MYLQLDETIAKMMNDKDSLKPLARFHSVNGGVDRIQKIQDKQFMVEICGPGYSGHRDNIINIMAEENGKMIEVSIYINILTSLYNADLFFFKKVGVQHYYSKCYRDLESMPYKYKLLAFLAIKVYNETFNKTYVV